MLIIKCPKEGCAGHLVAFNAEGLPVLIPNRDHTPEKTTITPEIRKQIEAEMNSEPFSTFMDVVKEETKKKGEKKQNE